MILFGKNYTNHNDGEIKFYYNGDKSKNNYVNIESSWLIIIFVNEYTFSTSENQHQFVTLHEEHDFLDNISP